MKIEPKPGLSKFIVYLFNTFMALLLLIFILVIVVILIGGMTTENNSTFLLNFIATLGAVSIPVLLLFTIYIFTLKFPLNLTISNDKLIASTLINRITFNKDGLNIKSEKFTNYNNYVLIRPFLFSVVFSSKFYINTNEFDSLIKH